MATTAAGFPVVLKIHRPRSSSLVRRLRMASSSSRAICSGHQFAPAPVAFSSVFAVTASGARTVMVAVRASRFNLHVHKFVVQPAFVDVRFERCERIPFAPAGPVALLGELASARCLTVFRQIAVV